MTGMPVQRTVSVHHLARPVVVRTQAHAEQLANSRRCVQPGCHSGVPLCVHLKGSRHQAGAIEALAVHVWGSHGPQGCMWAPAHGWHVQPGHALLVKDNDVRCGHGGCQCWTGKS